MIKFTKPEILDGFYLKNELTQAGVNLITKEIYEIDGALFLDITAKDKDIAAAVIAAHKGDAEYQGK